MFEEQEYHRRRAEAEMECALSADKPTAAITHLELARMHRARRDIITEARMAEVRQMAPLPIFRTDKEG